MHNFSNPPLKVSILYLTCSLLMHMRCLQSIYGGLIDNLHLFVKLLYMVNINAGLDNTDTFENYFGFN